MNERVDDATLAFMESGYRAMSNTERSLHQRDVMLCLAELRRLRELVANIDMWMGPKAPPCCDGCHAEWTMVLEALYAELGESSYTKRARRLDASPPIEGTVTDAPPEPSTPITDGLQAQSVNGQAPREQDATHATWCAKRTQTPPLRCTCGLDRVLMPPEASVYETPKPLTQSEQNTVERKP